jgi:uncharacterized FlaG/YvyC family protein
MKQGWNSGQQQQGQQQQDQQQQGQQQQGQQQQGQQQQGQQLNTTSQNMINIMKSIPDEKLKQSLYNAFGQYMLAVKSQTDYYMQYLNKMKQQLSGMH